MLLKSAVLFPLHVVVSVDTICLLLAAGLSVSACLSEVMVTESGHGQDFS